jgi:hypothetical protein
MEAAIGAASAVLGAPRSRILGLAQKLIARPIIAAVTVKLVFLRM